MTDKDKSKIQRMLGKIEAVAFVVDDKFQTPLFAALKVLDEIFDREEGAEKCQMMK